jgi:class 3 adenylate cyclase
MPYSMHTTPSCGRNSPASVAARSARSAARASAGSVGRASEVLVSSTLRDLVIGSGLELEDRGAHELNGVPGEWRLFAVAGE